MEVLVEFIDDHQSDAVTATFLLDLLSTGIWIMLSSDREVDRLHCGDSLQKCILLLASLFVRVAASDGSSVGSLLLRIDLIPWIVYHPFTSVVVRRKFSKSVRSSPRLASLLRETIPCSLFADPYLLVSDQMLQSESLLTRQAALGFARFLVEELQLLSFLNVFEVALSVENFQVKNARNIEEFERNIVAASDRYEVYMTPTIAVLASIGYINHQVSGGLPGGKKLGCGGVSSSSRKKFFIPHFPVSSLLLHGHTFLDDDQLLLRKEEELS